MTDKGHDAFLLDEPELFDIVRGFLDAAARARVDQAEVIMLAREARPHPQPSTAPASISSSSPTW